jgi:hypothetical protein
MSTIPYEPGQSRGESPSAGAWNKLWRETSRLFRRQHWEKWTGTENRRDIRLLKQEIQLLQKEIQHLRVKPATDSLESPFEQGTVEPEGLAFLARLVKMSHEHPGPIIEVGTLFGRTATHMALFKAPAQKIITVDCYLWNPWQLPREKHFSLTSQVLYYLIQTGHVEQVRMDKNLFYATYRGPAPSLVFLDADHTYEETKKDIEWAKSVGAALIAGHDYSDRFPGVQRIVHEHGGPKEVGGTVFLLP